ncbi:CCA tRNA nucleotidyltransferase [Marinilactibacillus kalidii]|uniref:CCA tRNA nucleotidyltransferase n=1 Tax=Marinilactibacillus kalidii TaxID=2820274 RepID=UPI001ABDFF74|nr:CCA tRNA nucleotidyltransferase [Marinilactibacillus kalidii]
MRKSLPLSAVFLEALPVLTKLTQAGYEAYFVGGSVRDALLGKTVNDVDIATSAFPNEIKALFNKTIDVGIDHGTVMVLWNDLTYEITTFRTESTYQDYRRPDSVTFVRSLSEDLKRRDFTINALAMDSNGNVTDLFQGITDLEKQTIRAVGKADERFGEDALRMMRATRFAAQLGFEIESNTHQALSHNAHLLKHVAVERIQVEFIKMCLGLYKNKGLPYFIESNLYQFCPSLQEKPLKQLAELKTIIENERQLWSLYLLFSESTDQEIKQFMKKWKLSNKQIQQVTALISSVRFRLDHPVSRPYIYHLGLDLALESENLLQMIGRRSDKEKIKETYDLMPIYSKQDLAVTGKDLLRLTESKAGQWLGDALNAVEEAVLSGSLNNNKKDIVDWLLKQSFVPKQ